MGRPGHCRPSLPLHEYPSLHGVHDAPEPRLLLAPSQHHPHLPREGGGQPVADLGRHGVRLNVTELILRIQEAPGHKRHNQGAETTSEVRAPRSNRLRLLATPPAYPGTKTPDESGPQQHSAFGERLGKALICLSGASFPRFTL